MPSSAVGYGAVQMNIDLEVLGSNSNANVFFFLFTFFIPSQSISEDIVDQIEKNFRIILHLHFSICRHFTSETEIESLKGQFLCFNCGLNLNLHLVCVRFYAISDTLSCKESKSANGIQYVLFTRYFLLF